MPHTLHEVVQRTIITQEELAGGGHSIPPRPLRLVL